MVECSDHRIFTGVARASRLAALALSIKARNMTTLRRASGGESMGNGSRLGLYYEQDEREGRHWH
jgi:hypothetical protein